MADFTENWRLMMIKRIGAWRIWVALALGIGSLALLAGCSGLTPGGNQAQQGPPGLSSPPGMKTGGAKTVLGTAVTAPDNYTLSVRFTLAPTVPATVTAATYKGAWHHCRRIIVSDGVVMVEGIDFDEPNVDTGTEGNLALPNSSLVEFTWRYDRSETSPTTGAQPGEPNSAGSGPEPNAPARGR